MMIDTDITQRHISTRGRLDLSVTRLDELLTESRPSLGTTTVNHDKMSNSKAVCFFEKSPKSQKI